MFGAHYLKNRWRYRLGDNGAPIENGHLGINWSRDRCRHVTLKCQDLDPNALKANISKTAGDTGFVPKDLK